MNSPVLRCAAAGRWTDDAADAQSTPTNQFRRSSIIISRVSEPPRCPPIPLLALAGADSPRGIHRSHSPAG